MVSIAIRRNSAGSLIELRCQGHAGFDDGTGNDLVCAAVSALTGALGLGLTEVEGMKPDHLSVGPGDFGLRLSGEQARRAHLLTETIVRALLQMEEHYKGSLKVRTL